MATIIAKNSRMAFLKCMSLLYGISNEADKPVGHAPSKLKRRIWIKDDTGAPSGAAETGMVAGDLILNIVDDEVYRYISSTTYANVTADS